MQRHLKHYVINTLFRGEHPPPVSRRRFYPTRKDIRNILNAQRSGDRKAPDDQDNLKIKCEEWQQIKSEDSIFFRVN